MLRVDIKSNKSTKWETLARATTLEAAKFCNTLDEFVNYFTSVLKDRKRDSVGVISDSYKVLKSSMSEQKPHKVFVMHTPAGGKIRIIAEVIENL